MANDSSILQEKVATHRGLPQFDTKGEIGEWLTQKTRKAKAGKLGSETWREIEEALAQGGGDTGMAGVDVAIHCNSVALLEIVERHYPITAQEFIAEFKRQHADLDPLGYAILERSYGAAKWMTDNLGDNLQAVIRGDQLSFASLLVYRTADKWQKEDLPLLDDLERTIVREMGAEGVRNLLIMVAAKRPEMMEMIVETKMVNFPNGPKAKQEAEELNELVFNGTVAPDIQAKIFKIRSKYEKDNLEAVTGGGERSRPRKGRSHL